MSSIAAAVNTALSAIIANTWAVELPPDPQYPACVFDIDTDPEKNWVQGGGYVRHEIVILVFSKSRADLDSYASQIKTAMESINSGVYRYMEQDSQGDANYEDLPGVYGHYQTHIIRQRI